MFSYLCFLIYMLSFTLCIFFYVMHFCRIFATALYPYLCFSFFYVMHFCRIFATALITCELISPPFHSLPSFLIFSSIFPLKRG